MIREPGEIHVFGHGCMRVNPCCEDAGIYTRGPIPMKRLRRIHRPNAPDQTVVVAVRLEGAPRGVFGYTLPKARTTDAPVYVYLEEAPDLYFPYSRDSPAWR